MKNCETKQNKPNVVSAMYISVLSLEFQLSEGAVELGFHWPV